MLVNFNDMLDKAKKEHYAVPQFNINNLEWTKYILEECNKKNIPVILGVSLSAVNYMGGYDVVVSIVKSLIKDLNINIPVCLHLDHGSEEACKKAIDAGFSSVMIDASDHKLEDNIKITKIVVNYAHLKNISVEAEIGIINNNNENCYASVSECLKLYKETNIDALAPAVGTSHGVYIENPKLDFKRIKDIKEQVNIPLVLHGGSGVPYEQIEKAILYGITKININTELQIEWKEAITKFIDKNSDIYDPRKIISSGEQNIKNKIDELISVFKTKKCD